MVKLKALKTFSAGGAKLTYQNEEFDAPKDRAEEYLRLKLAEEIHNPNENTAATENLNEEFAQEFTDISENLRQENSPQDEAQEVAAPISDWTQEELLNKNMKELKEIAKNIGVNGYSQSSKSELIFSIRAQQIQNNTMEV